MTQDLGQEGGRISGKIQWPQGDSDINASTDPRPMQPNVQTLAPPHENLNQKTPWLTRRRKIVGAVVGAVVGLGAAFGLGATMNNGGEARAPGEANPAISGSEVPGPSATPHADVVSPLPETTTPPVLPEYARLDTPIPPVEDLTIANEALKNPNLEIDKVKEYLSEKLSSALTHDSPLTDFYIGGDHIRSRGERELTLVVPDKEKHEADAKEKFKELVDNVGAYKGNGRSFKVVFFKEPQQTEAKPLMKILDPSEGEQTKSLYLHRAHRTHNLELIVYDARGWLEYSNTFSISNLALGFVPTNENRPSIGQWMFIKTKP